MKKVLIANKFYYNRGGDCIASISLEKLLIKKGHEVAFFSMQHPENFHSEWMDYFPSQVDFQSDGLTQKIQAASRLFYSKEVVKKFNMLLDDFKPDILHLNNIHSQLSPIIGEIAHNRGIKVVWTLHDKKLICPTYSCLRQGKTCELCITDSKINVLRHKCMKDSLPASLLAYFESLYWNKKRLVSNTDCFITPSDFLKRLMEKGGFPTHKLKSLPHFSDRDFSTPLHNREEYYCYVGRLSEEKGIINLVKAAKELPFQLIVIGDGPLRNSLPSSNNIEYVGYKEWAEIKQIIATSKFLVCPSECYEVFGLSNIESLSLGTPVLGANIGGIPELINAQNGMLFEAGNTGDLQEKIQQMFDREFNYSDICSSAREKYSAERYYNKLMEIYEQ